MDSKRREYTGKCQSCFYLNYLQINEVRNSDHMVSSRRRSGTWSAPAIYLDRWWNYGFIGFACRFHFVKPLTTEHFLNFQLNNFGFGCRSQMKRWIIRVRFTDKETMLSNFEKLQSKQDIFRDKHHFASRVILAKSLFVNKFNKGSEIWKYFSKIKNCAQ